MKIRSITLTNVRRFAGTTVTLDGLGPGLNLVCAPNEAGKSTFFEALDALVFLAARSGGAEARALQPYSGGPPAVEAEVELDGGRFRIAKRWLQRPFARVSGLPSGRVIAQDDEAEAWIARHLAAGGLPGMLWVRQGQFALDPEGSAPADKAERERRARIRRDLLSSVAAEIDAVTGGKRLDAIAARCEAALAGIATATGRPKAGGRWRQAEDEAADLGKEMARLDAQCGELASALAERAEVRDALARATDPAAVRARDTALADARRAAEAARAHQARLDTARAARQAAVLERDAAAAALASHDRAGRNHAAAATAATLAAEAARVAAETLAEANAGEATAAQAAEAAVAAHDGARERQAAAERAARAAEALARAEAAEARLRRAATLAATIASATAEAGAAGVSDADLRAATAAAARLDRARDRMAAGAVTLALDYLPGTTARATIDGRPLEAPFDCVGPTTLDLPGLGRLTVTPGGDAALAAGEAAEAEAEFVALLTAAGAPDLAALSVRADRRAAVEGEAARARAEVAGLAPDGAAALEAEAARHRAAAAGADPDAPDPAEAAAAEAAARVARENAERARTAARDARVGAAHAAATAVERHQAADRALAAAAAEAGALPDRAAVAERLDACRAAADAADRTLATLEAAMPDAAAAEVALARAEAAIQLVEADRHRLERRDGELGMLIATRSDEGVEERRDETAGRLEAATARAAGYAAEARALARLRDALATARADARDRYLAPVEAELAPLLGLVLDDADLALDPARLLPETLTRGGVAEDLACLSGGTREQIAILTRLAFARLLARSGRATPVILDDAVVYADDARFARVLEAIAAVAGDVQVILLTCRERSFADVPGARPVVALLSTDTVAAS